ncbi:SRPBCC family protein [Gaopeijia maritima]|uniref:SRPBCC family protein n=1 Tax=Gaopeijia maritima TaxID=3119007 RepID=UPI00324C3FE0
MITFANLGGGRHELHTEAVLPLSRGEVFPFFAAAENLERITPPELAFRIVTPTPVDIREEVRIDYRLRLFGVPFSWRTRISEWDPPHAFIDEQEAGPYHTWIHRHEFVEVTGGTRMTDRVVFDCRWPPCRRRRCRSSAPSSGGSSPTGVGRSDGY